MSSAVLLAGTAGALGGAGLADLGPDAVAVARRALRRGRGDAPVGQRMVRAVPACAVLGMVLLLAGAPMVGAVVGLGPVGVRAVLRARADRRRGAIGHGAPLVARAVADALDAGHGVRRAITEAARSSGPAGPAADELRRVAARLHAGDPLAGALDAWRRRTAEPAHRTIVAGLLLHGDAGGELADVLRDQASALERSRRATAEAESAIVQARTAARIVGGIPAAIAIGAVVLAPGTVRAVTGSALGTALVVCALGLQGAAVVAVRRLTTGLGR